MSKLTDRKNIILNSIINEYILKGNPVASRILKKTYSISCSPATIRNEMAELEEMGFLKRSHNFSGRIPSDSGLRYYIDHLINPSNIDKADYDKINRLEGFNMINNVKSRLIKEIYHYSLNILNQMSSQASFLFETVTEKCSLKKINIIKISDFVYVMFIQTDDNIIENKLWFSKENISEDNILILNNILEVLTRDKGELKNTFVNFMSKNPTLNYLKDYLRSIIDLALNSNIDSNIENKLYIEGLKNIINKPEFEDVSKMRNIVELFENKDIINHEIKKLIDLKKLNIIIGNEFQETEMEDLSIISMPVYVNNKKSGVLGVVGSKRMEYSRIINVIRETSLKISNILSGFNIKS